jgi:hypothetical protein
MPRSPDLLKIVLTAVLLFSAIHSPATAQPTTELKRETIRGFEEYISNLEKEFHSILSAGRQISWTEQMGVRQRAKLRKGEIAVKRFDEAPELSHGIIHDWGAAMFVPDVDAQAVVALLTDYDRHRDIYSEVVDSKLIEQGNGYRRGFLRLEKQQVLTVVLNTEHEARIINGGENNLYIFSHSTRIAEVRDAGEPDKEELPVGRDSGFLWRLNAYWGIHQVEDGVYIECDTISLSRDIPWGLGWMIGPFVKKMPRETLEETFQATRRELLREKLQ